jgi:hypothetical protein
MACEATAQGHAYVRIVGFQSIKNIRYTAENIILIDIVNEFFSGNDKNQQELMILMRKGDVSSGKSL